MSETKPLTAVHEPANRNLNTLTCKWCGHQWNSDDRRAWSVPCIKRREAELTERKVHEQTQDIARELAAALKLTYRLPLPWMEGATSITFEQWNEIWKSADAALAKYHAQFPEEQA